MSDQRLILKPGLDSAFATFSVFFFFFFFFLAVYVDLSPMYNAPMHCSQDAHTSLFNNFFIKNGFHDTIHTFKNYFTIVFSVFSFQQNKSYPNGP